jgi:formylglycine-generating enzyme required for sulfatase activity
MIISLIAGSFAGCAGGEPAAERRDGGTASPASSPTASSAEPTPEMAAEIARLVKQLGDDDFKVREAATSRLVAIGKPVLSQLKIALEEGDAETRMRAQNILTKIWFNPWPFDAREARRLQEEAAKALGTPVEKEVDLEGGVNLKLALIPAGDFEMGSPETEKSRFASEGPQHKVRITEAFYMGTTEVTQRQWKAVMGNNPSKFQGDDLPVADVSWKDCQEFLKKLSTKERKTYRLPTEAEWEYACRAGSTMPFAFGETISAGQANYNGHYVYGNGKDGENREEPTPVASFIRNAWGLHDMHGNVWEWCEDWYDENYYRISPASDPTGPAQGTSRVGRGGSWYLPPSVCRSASRGWITPYVRDHFVGFRVVLSTSSRTPAATGRRENTEK